MNLKLKEKKIVDIMPQYKCVSTIKSEPSESVRENFPNSDETSIMGIKQERIDDSRCSSASEKDSVNGRVNEDIRTADEEPEAEIAVNSESKPKKKRKNPIKRSKKQKSGGKSLKRSNPQNSSEMNEELNQQVFQDIKNNDSELCTDAINSDITQNRTFYSCKLCKKDFSSAFILCLHLQIHEKVGSVQIIEDDNTQSENIPSPVEDEPDVLEETVDHIKEEICEEIIDFGETCSAVTDEPGVCLEKNEPRDFLNKNFVENLKKNLSLAMNRKL